MAGIKANIKVLDYCAENLPSKVHILDAGHNIGEVVQTTTSVLRTLKNNQDKSVEEIFTSHPLTPQAPRIAVRESNFDGLLSSPTIPGKTVLIFQIGKAAIETKDINFTFSTGSSERACVFKDFFLEFMKDLQQELRQTNSQG